jgi:two-component system OmpR family sensor kinase
MALASRSRGRWKFVKSLPGRTPLRVRLIAAELALVAIALAGVSVAGISIVRGYLLKHQNQALFNTVYSGTLEINVQNEVAARLASGRDAHHVSTRLSADWLSKGKLYHVIYPISGYSYMGYPVRVPGPSYSASASWIAAEKPAIVSAESGNGRWDVMSTPMVILTPHGAVSGTMIVGLNMSPGYQLLNKLIGIDILVSVILLVGALILGIMVLRMSLRPLTEIQQTADAIAAGDLAQRVPELDPRTEFGSTDRSLNRMLTQIETAFRTRSSSERAARRSEKRMRQFIAELSHELRIPLTAIRSHAEYYRHRSRPRAADVGPLSVTGSNFGQGGNGDSAGHNGAADPASADLEKIIGRVEQESDRMAEVLEDVLLLARLDQNGKLDTGLVDIRALADDAVREAGIAAPTRTINFSVDANAEPIVNGDAAQLRQVIGNLMRNALARAPDGTAIDVRIGSASRSDLQAALPTGEAESDAWPATLMGTAPDEAAVEPIATVLEVTDYGRGLTEEQSARAFEQFYRADGAGTSTDSGLGLAIVGATVKAHGGAAWVRWQPGNRSAFCIALPLKADPKQDFDQDQQAARLQVAEPELASLQNRPGIEVSYLSAGAGSELVDAWRAGRTDLNGTENGNAPLWIESGPPDEISFLALRSPRRREQHGARPPGKPRRTGRHAQEAGAAGGAERGLASRQRGVRPPGRRPVSRGGAVRRTGSAWPGQFPCVRRAQPGR